MSHQEVPGPSEPPVVKTWRPLSPHWQHRCGDRVRVPLSRVDAESIPPASRRKTWYAAVNSIAPLSACHSAPSVFHHLRFLDLPVNHFLKLPPSVRCHAASNTAGPILCNTSWLDSPSLGLPIATILLLRPLSPRLQPMPLCVSPLRAHFRVYRRSAGPRLFRPGEREPRRGATRAGRLCR